MSEQDVHFEVLRRRSARFARLVELRGPTAILQCDARLLLRAIVAALGSPVREDVWSWVAAKNREDLGLCPFDGNPMNRLRGMCDECWDRAGAEDAEMADATPRADKEGQ